LEFEKRRNEPVKYSRELWKNTIDAMEKIDKIKSKREAHFIMKRLDKGVKDRKEDDLREVKVNLAMVRAPGAKESRLDNILESKLGIVSARKKAEEIKIVDTRQESEAAKKKELEMEVEV